MNLGTICYSELKNWIPKFGEENHTVATIYGTYAHAMLVCILSIMLIPTTMQVLYRSIVDGSSVKFQFERNVINSDVEHSIL